jgi:hypothetical protein
MEEYVSDVYAQIKTVDELDAQYGEDDMGTVILNMFKEGTVETILSFKEDDDSGMVFVAFAYGDKYFYLYEWFGSCYSCDDWYADTYESHAIELDRLKKKIRDNIVQQIYEITVPFYNYAHPELREAWTDVLKQHGPGVYEQCWSLAQEREEERTKEYRHRQEIEREAARKQRLECDTGLVADAKELITYLKTQNDETDEYFKQKLSSNIRKLQFYINRIDGVLGNFDREIITDLKTRLHKQLDRLSPQSPPRSLPTQDPFCFINIKPVARTWM